MRRTITLFGCGLIGFSGAALAQDVHVVGLEPSTRPEWAPRIETLHKSGAWYDAAVHGVSEPYPATLRFLEDQGAWFTPFNHPGMTPPYDLRNWHDQTFAN